MPQHDTEYLTTRELAELLRIKERKVYDLAASGQIPCSRAMGKLLFPRQEIESWLARESSGGVQSRAMRRPGVLLGSYEPLLEWALRESGCGLATLLDGSLDGLERFAHDEGVATGLHIYDPVGNEWNVASVTERFAQAPVVLVEFAWRERGLIVLRGAEAEFADVAALKGRRMVPRQVGAGSQVLLLHLLGQAGLGAQDVQWADVARTESDAALAVLEGKADATLGLRAMADQLRLGFVPLLRERYDLLVDRRAWFDPPMQRLVDFCRGAAFQAKAAALAGYDVDGFGKVHFNGA
ncbi:MAG: helix-turn-helix transcriptional regulator [Chromatiaceae bacterium]|jgi:excisionase family DNA binding protein|nr:helix-turn-helix transcriptional regulator [Chromatiaceae bacterium]